MTDSKYSSDSTNAETLNELTERLSGAYMYDGNGQWSQINKVVLVSDTIEFRTERVSYESVPHDTRQNAYDQYDKEEEKTVIVGADVADVITASTERNTPNENTATDKQNENSQPENKQHSLDEDTDIEANDVLSVLRDFDRPPEDEGRPLAVVSMEKYLFDAKDGADLNYGTVRNAMEQTDGRLCLRYEDEYGHGYLALADGKLRRLMMPNHLDTYNGPYGISADLLNEWLHEKSVKLTVRKKTPFEGVSVFSNSKRRKKPMTTNSPNPSAMDKTDNDTSEAQNNQHQEHPADNETLLMKEEIDSRAGDMEVHYLEDKRRRLVITLSEKEFQVALYCGLLFRHPFDDGFIYFGPWQDVEESPGITRCLITKYTEPDLRSGVNGVYDNDEYADIEFKLASAKPEHPDNNVSQEDDH